MLLFASNSGKVTAQDDNVTAVPSITSYNETEEPSGWIVEEASTIDYSLPSFSLNLKVSKSDNALIAFQDQLEEVIQLHLESFYTSKLRTDSHGNDRVKEVALKSKLVWRELSINQGESRTDLEPQVQGIVKYYEVRGKYDCNISLYFDEEDAFVATQSLMNLFFIEAFQADNYWDLLNSFLVSPVLEEINDFSITILEDGFVPYDGQPSISDSTSSNMSPTMIVGMAFATLFCIALLGMWAYLCCMVNGASFYKLAGRRGGRRRSGDSVYKDGSVTDDAHTSDSADDDEESGVCWMDVWAHTVTSIPLREPTAVTSGRRKRGRPSRQSFVRPAHEHRPSLDCIDESDSESCASGRTEASGRSSRRKPHQPTSTPMGYFSSIAELDDPNCLVDRPGIVPTKSEDSEDPSFDCRSVASEVTIWQDDTPSVAE